jgi:hypothetical protein
MIVGGAIGLHLVTLMLPGDDDVAGVPAGVDDSAEVACGAIVEVARLMLVLFGTRCLRAACLVFLSLCHSFWMSSSSSIFAVPIVLDHDGRMPLLRLGLDQCVRDVVVVVDVVVVQLNIL